MTGSAPAAAGRRWERGLLACLAGLSALAWLATGRLAMPSMRAGILTGHRTGDARLRAAVAAGSYRAGSSFAWASWRREVTPSFRNTLRRW
jgi:hypothetical protein